MNKPLVSVVIPAYNASEFIADTLKSVFAQTYDNLEVIVVDDGSSDGTLDIASSFSTLSRAGVQRPLLCLQQSNGGPSKARNAGISRARGEFLAFLDADDLWSPDAVEQFVSYLIAHPEVSLVFGDAGSFDAHGIRFHSFFAEYGRPEACDNGIIKKGFEKLLENNFILTGALLIRKKAIEKVGAFDLAFHYGEDYDLWVRIALYGRIAAIDNVVMMRRIHEANLSQREFSFYNSKVLFLKKIKKTHAEELARLKIQIDKYILKSLKKRSYIFYLRKNYPQFVKSLIQLGLYQLKSFIRPEQFQ